MLQAFEHCDRIYAEARREDASPAEAGD